MADRRYALTGLTQMQGRLIVMMVQHLQEVFRGNPVDAAAIIISCNNLCLENKVEMQELSRMIERLHEQVGCCENCRHKKPKEAKT